MTETEFLLLVRGSAFTIATVILLLGSLVRILEIVVLGRKPDHAPARGSAMGGGLRTIATRMFPDSGSWKRSSFTITTGYVFHIGLFVTIFLFAPHILFFYKVLGVQWTGLPSPVIDATAVVTIIALLMVLLHRLSDGVLRLLSGFQDYLTWLATLLPLVTGYMAFHRMGLSAPMLLALHILSVEFLMVLFPFTKLSHAFTLILARWYNGAIAGYRGIRS